MHVVATAGHVDHGKSTLVRGLTGMEPDRWAQERARGMTIDLGYAWTGLPSGEVLAFVDVPGHQRFIGNMLAGLGPAPAVLFVVAADEGWRRQSAEHLAAVHALGLEHGLLVVTRSDLADPGAASREALAQLEKSSLGRVPSLAVSAVTGRGLPELREQLDALVGRLPAPDEQAPVRLWVDRAFTVKGAGTVVTGTLGAGTLRVGDTLALGRRTVRVRGLQALGRQHDQVAAVARVAVNLRGVELAEVRRGDTLLTPGRWREVTALDVRLCPPVGGPADLPGLPDHLVLHVGSAAVPARVRPLGADTARLLLDRSLPLRAGDRALLREPAGQRVVAGVLVLDADPPGLRRRGSAARRAGELSSATGWPDLAAEVARRGHLKVAEADLLGLPVRPDDGIWRSGDWLVSPARWDQWVQNLLTAVLAHEQRAPLEAGLPEPAAARQLALPDLALLAALADEAGLERTLGRLRRPGTAPQLGLAEQALRTLESGLRDSPYAAVEPAELAALGLGPRVLAAAETAGRVVRLGGGVVLLQDGPTRAVQVLAGLPQPFTVGEARHALGCSRKVAVALVEHLDAQGWTRRLDALRREVTGRL